MRIFYSLLLVGVTAVWGWTFVAVALSLLGMVLLAGSGPDGAHVGDLLT
ncbi:MAG: molecular chaperone DnaJ, partial [Rubrobacter sp.]|nr:molecular chaperone DnaJ [Rubrobacter sp.]